MGRRFVSRKISRTYSPMDAQAEQLDRAHEQHGHEHAGPAPRAGVVVEGVNEDPDQHADRHDDRQETQVRDQPQRVAAEADQAVDPQAHQPAERVFGLAGLRAARS